MQHLITTDELISTGRPISKQTDENKLLAFINEAEQMNIKPVLGDDLFLDLLENGEEQSNYIVLLGGGTYTVDEQIYTFAGLKQALSYYVYAKYVMVGDFNATRFGVMMKDDSYSSHISAAERSNAYNDSLEIANFYLQECIDYCKRVGILKNKVGRPKATGGVKIRKIG